MLSKLDVTHFVVRVCQAAVLLCLLLFSAHQHKRSWAALDQPIKGGFITHAQGVDSIGAEAWDFEFIEIERLLESVQSMAGKVLLNSNTLNKLDLAYDQIERQKNVVVWPRLQLLVEKSFSSNMANELASLLNNYQQYQSNIELMDSALPRATKLARQLEWQTQIFGQQTATALFAKRNLQARYLLDRQVLQTDSTLNPDLKKQQLQSLQTEYKRRLKLVE